MLGSAPTRRTRKGTVLVELNSEERQAMAALDDAARLIAERCHILADWGWDAPYATVMQALHRRVLDLTSGASSRDTPHAGMSVTS